MSERKKQNTIYTIIGTIGGLCVLLVIMSKIPVYGTYKNPYYKFQIKYPDGWIVTENKFGTAVTFNSHLEHSLDVFSENFNIVVQNISPDMTFDQFTNVAIFQVKQVFTAMMLEDEGPATLSGQEAAKFVYTVRGDEANLKFMNMWTISGTKAYILTFTANVKDFDRYYPIAKKMFNSFKITD